MVSAFPSVYPSLIWMPMLYRFQTWPHRKPIKKFLSSQFWINRLICVRVLFGMGRFPCLRASRRKNRLVRFRTTSTVARVSPSSYRQNMDCPKIACAITAGLLRQFFISSASRNIVNTDGSGVRTLDEKTGAGIGISQFLSIAISQSAWT